MQRMMSCSNNWKNDMEMLMEYNRSQEQLLQEQIDQSNSEETKQFEQLHHSIAHELYDEILLVEKDQVKEVDVPDSGADIDLSLWNDMEEESVDGEAVKGVQCIKTQKRRDLKMKKHRRAKRKKVMLLKLKASGKI